MRRKRIFILVLNVKPDAVLELLEYYGCLNTCTLRNEFSLSPSSLRRSLSHRNQIIDWFLMIGTFVMNELK